MRTPTCCLFLLLACLHQAYAADCSPAKIFGDSRIDTDPRDLRTFNAVIRIAGVGNTDKPLLCAAEDPIIGQTPIIFQATRSDPWVLLLPAVMRKFSDEGLTGVLTHEIGHLFEGFTSNAALGKENELEERVDARAATWVGKDSVRQGLKEVIAYILPLYPQWTQKRVLPQINERLTLLK